MVRRMIRRMVKYIPYTIVKFNTAGIPVPDDLIKVVVIEYAPHIIQYGIINSQAIAKAMQLVYAQGRVSQYS